MREAAAVLLDERLVAFVAPATGTIDAAALRALGPRAPAGSGGAGAHRESRPRCRGTSAASSIAPRSASPRACLRAAAARELEQTVAQLFADLLGREPIGADDDFFDLGGDSLLAVQLVAEIEALTGRTAALDAIAAAPTPRGIAATLTADGFPWQTTDCITLHPNGGGAPLFAHLRRVGVGRAPAARRPRARRGRRRCTRCSRPA